MKGREKMKVIIAAAGTAGHINPGLAIANKIKKEEKDSEIMFIGTTRGLENDLVPRAGYELKTIDAYGLSKKISIEHRLQEDPEFCGLFLRNPGGKAEIHRKPGSGRLRSSSDLHETSPGQKALLLGQTSGL